MKNSAGVVIAGAGVIGASVAYHLASRGCRDVLVVDCAPKTGEGSTGRATGGFRAQFATEINVRLSLLARRKLIRFADETGGDAEYRPCGYLFLAQDRSQLEALRAARIVQHAAGLTEAREVSPSEIRELNSAVVTDGLAGGAFCPTDGFVRPLKILDGYLAAAQRLGARVEVVRVTARGIETSKGAISAPNVVNALGAWAGALSAIPVTPLKRQVAPTVPTDVLPASMPMTIFLEDGFHLRVRDGRVLLLQPHETPAAFDTTFDEAWLEGIVRSAHQRIPALKGVAIDRGACWAGLYEMSPDRHALLGRHDGVWLANGSSGHGVMHAAALGELLAQQILGEATSIDVAALRPSRFAEGKPNAHDGLL